MGSPAIALIRVGMAQWRLSDDLDAVFNLPGLGSCIAVAIYDPVCEIAAVAHVMLPTSGSAGLVAQPAKFADTGVGALVDALAERGADPGRMVAKAAGGAQMFRSGGSSLPLGARNAEAVIVALAAARIPVLAADLGGTSGRTVRFHMGTWRLEVRSAQRPLIEI